MPEGTSRRLRNPSLPIGKLPPRLLKAQIETLASRDPRLVIGPRFGEDASVIDMGARFLVCSADPITLASARIGYYAVHINANDVAVMGARPRWFWATVLLPEEGSDDGLVESVFAEMREACGEIGVCVCGGHTEVTASLERPIVCGFMAGEVERGGLADKGNMRPGDVIILSRGIAIEGTATIAAERAELLERLDPAAVERARLLLKDPGISVVREAMIATGTDAARAMHDPTEGGLWLGLREMAEAAGVGLDITYEGIVILPETAAVCEAIGIDPGALLASGALLIASPPGKAAAILEAYEREGVPARVIGNAKEREFGLKLRRSGKLGRLPEVERDEITKIIPRRSNTREERKSGG